MVQHPSLWRHAIVPIVLNILITATVLVIGVITMAAMVMWLHDKFSDSWWGRASEAVTVVGLLLVVVAGSIASWMLFQGILCGYFNTKLATQVEMQLGIAPQEIKEVSFAYQVTDAIRNTAYLLGANATFLLVHLVPVVGSLVAVCGSLYFDCLILGREYLDYPLAMRGQSRDKKLEFFRRNRMQVLGLGASVLLLSVAPLVGAVLLASAVTGAVLLHRTLAKGTSE